MLEAEAKVREDLTEVKAQVEELLEKYPLARNSDTYLEILWLRYYGKVPLPWIEFGKIKTLEGKMESVRRTRQKIQNEERRFLPTDPDVLEGRRRKAEAYRRAIRQT